ASSPVVPLTLRNLLALCKPGFDQTKALHQLVSSTMEHAFPRFLETPKNREETGGYHQLYFLFHNQQYQKAMNLKRNHQATPAHPDSSVGYLDRNKVNHPA